MKRLRRTAQLMFLFLAILPVALAWPLGLRLLVEGSPLALLSASLAARSPVFGWGWLVLLLALPLGRGFCGWICPVGSLNHGIGRWSFKRPLRGRSIKFGLLALLLFGASMGMNPAGLFDPLSLWVRSGTALRGIGGDPRQALFLAPLLLVLALNFVAPRLWCRLICPLGALLGMTSWLWSKGSREGCSHCNLCSTGCPQGAAPPDGWLSEECVLCGHCRDRCPKQALSLSGPTGFQPPKRAFLGVAIAGFFLPWKNKDPLLRPPGAQDFLGRCVRCGACLRVCPTGALQPSLWEGGLEGLLAPKFTPRQGYCEPGCTRCGEACPTGAIRRLTVAQKNRAPIGLAKVDWPNCRECLRCQDACPQKALGQFPEVDRSRCNGCGACEWICPVEPAAIRVTREA